MDRAALWRPGWRNWLAVALLFVAGLADGARDGLQFHFDRTPFANAATYAPQFWNPAVSWKNKYQDGNPAHGERFPLATTALVFTTDAWHLFKFTMLNAFFLAALLFRLPGDDRDARPALAALAVGFVALHGSFSLGFALAYR